MVKKVSIVGVQTTPKMSSKDNLKAALSLIDEALQSYNYVDIVVLPEYFYDIDLEDTDRFSGYPEEVVEALSSRAKAYETYILGGTVLHRRMDGKLYNTAVLFDRRGKIVGNYDKTHLFDVLNGLGDDKESDYCESGDHLFTYNADFGKIGVSICYDIRFPELARTLALQGVEYLFTPAAFYSPRFDHWTDLISATALQNSMYVMGVNLFGELDEDEIFCGRSMLADPWGIPLAQASDKETIIHAYVDPVYPKIVREAIGTMQNRVPDLYEII